jgi:RNA polymerase sigma factor (sigma-70 family)
VQSREWAERKLAEYEWLVRWCVNKFVRRMPPCAGREDATQEARLAAFVALLTHDPAVRKDPKSLLVLSIFRALKNWRRLVGVSRHGVTFKGSALPPASDRLAALRPGSSSHAQHSLPSRGGGHSEFLEDREEAQHALLCAGLTEREKVVVRRRYWDDEELAEIGDYFGVTKQAVATSLSRAIGRMRRVVERD